MGAKRVSKQGVTVSTGNAIEVTNTSDAVLFSVDNTGAIGRIANLTAKGSILTASATSTPAALAVGNNGDTLVADSSTSTGLRYTAGNALGNPVLNSAFQIWQRGTSVSIAANTGGYSTDRWYLQNGVNQAVTITQQATADTTNLPFIQFCARVQRNSGQTGTGGINFGQPFETINSRAFAGKTVTISFYARAGANYSAASSALSFGISTGTGTDQNYPGYTGYAGAAGGTATLTTTWQRFSTSGAIGATVTEIAPIFTFTPTGTASTNDFYEITGVQIDVGSVALPFRTYAGTMQGELAACQRYYQRVTANAAVNVCLGVADSTTLGIFTISLSQTMRVRPTALETSGTPADYSIRFQGGASTALSAGPAFSTSSTDTLSFTGTVASGLTGGGALLFRFLTADVSFLGWSAEL
jgi:hypothetical protein